MSDAILVEIAAGCTVDQVREGVERITGERLKEVIDDDFGRHFITNENSKFFTTVRDQSGDLERDPVAPPFDRLPMVVSLDPYTTASGETLTDLCRSLALEIARTIHEELHCDCAVIEHYGTATAVFKSPGNDWLVFRTRG